MLVTGAAGQLGSAVVARAGELALPVVAAVSSDLDITDERAVERAVGAREPGDVLVNCAAYTAVDAAETDAGRAHAVNALGPGLLARACARAGVRLIHVSTDYVFAGDAHEPYDLDAPTAPRTVYGRTKLDGEIAVHRALPSAHVVRTAWVHSGTGTDFVATMRRLEGTRESVDVVTDQVGSPTYAPDLAAGLVELATTPVDAPILHATNAGVASWFDLARAVFEGIGADPERVHPCTSEQFVRPAPRPAYSVLSPRAWEAAGLTPLRPWREALADALAAG